MENVNEISNVNNSIIFRDNDIYAIQNRVNAFEAMLANCLEAFVVSGCVVGGTAPNNTISAGIVFIDGKLHRLPAVGSVDLGTTKYIKFLSATDSDPRALSGGGTQNRIKTYLAQVSNTAATFPLQSIAISQAVPARTFADVFAKKSDIVAPSVTTQTVTLEANWGSIDTSVSAVKNNVGQVTIMGQVNYSGTGAFLIATLPSGFRPYKDCVYTVASDTGTLSPSQIQATVRIKTNGEMSLAFSNPAIATGGQVRLDGINFYVAI